jgi:type IV pilus modification protein PilV
MGWPISDRNRGFSLIELSVATAVFSIGLSSLSLMMLSAIRGTDDAHHLTMAEMQAGSLAEFIAMNPGAVGHFVNPPHSQPLACLEQDCAPEAMAAAMMAAWQARVSAALPAGTGLACRDGSIHDGSPADAMCDGNGNLVIKVWWSEHGIKGEQSGLQEHVSRSQW